MNKRSRIIPPAAGSREKDRRPTAVDLFAGCGGLTSGLKAAGFAVLAAVEIDRDAAASYRANHSEVRLYERDIRQVIPGHLFNAVSTDRRRTIDLLAGCPPCQGFTRLTENKKRRDRRNGLVREFLRFVRLLLPKNCMLENVPGLLKTRKGRRYFNELCRGLEASGYKVTFGIVELADYGVPQFRKRLVVLGSRKSAIPIPPPTHRRPVTSTTRAGVWRTVRHAIEDLPVPPRRSEVQKGKARPQYKWHYARDVSGVVRRRLAHALKHGRGRTSLPESLRLECHKRHADGYYDVYGVMDWDLPSPTMTSGCTNASKGRFGHPSQPRPLTAAEAAALQTFPRSYKFCGGLESVATQVGNALPRRFAKVMARAVRKSLKD